MGGASRILMLLPSRHSLLLRRLDRNSRILSPSLPLSTPNYSTRHYTPFSPLRADQSESFHSQSSAAKDESFAGQSGRGGGSSASSPNWYHPWPEWSKFIYGVRQAGYFERVGDGDTWGVSSGDNFSSPEFLKAARACLEFAHDRDNLLGCLSRSDIRVVVENGSAYLFRDAEKLRSRMKSFLGIVDSNVAKLDKATMVDLMKFLLSYANICPVSSADGFHSNEQIVVSSVRNLLSELARFSYGAGRLDSPGSMYNHNSDRYGQAPRPQRRIEMKMGDWICPRCTFMNFARNAKCFDCEEARPKRQRANGEWECPQCEFFNFGRNMTCIRCDGKCPGEMTLSPAHPQSSRLNTSDTGIQPSTSQKAHKGSFQNITNGTRISYKYSAMSDKNLYGDTKSYGHAGNRPSALENSVQNDGTLIKLNHGDTQSSFEISGVGRQDFNDKYSVRSVNTQICSTSNSSGYCQEENMTVKYCRSGKSLEGSAVKETDPLDASEEAKAERWFRRAAQIKDISELSQIPDEDFPSIMPMRKGVNRFVVSKRKTPLERRLISPQYRRNLPAVEEADPSKTQNENN